MISRQHLLRVLFIIFVSAGVVIPRIWMGQEQHSIYLSIPEREKLHVIDSPAQTLQDALDELGTLLEAVQQLVRAMHTTLTEIAAFFDQVVQTIQSVPSPIERR